MKVVSAGISSATSGQNTVETQRTPRFPERAENWDPAVRGKKWMQNLWVLCVFFVVSVLSGWNADETQSAPRPPDAPAGSVP